MDTARTTIIFTLIIFALLLTRLLNVAAIENVTVITNDTKGDTTIQIEGEEEFDIYDETDTAWIEDAVVNVGYYLRSHKFNEWDRRLYDKKPDEFTSNLYKSFPDPPLRYFHWEVFNHCKYDFVTCLRYLYETVIDAYLQHSIDTVYVMKKRNLSEDRDRDEMFKTNEECERLKELDESDPQPFKDILDRFQWRVTASYYMCKFTIQETESLRHFNETCDNFANCLQEGNKTMNLEVRANDTVPFACAMYSFCPDSCCPHIKILKKWENCWNDTGSGNPCEELADSKCSFNKTNNLSFPSMVYNEWNVSCVCPQRESLWRSRYHMCIYYDLCSRRNLCDSNSENCLNSDNNSYCDCKFGFRRKPHTITSGSCHPDELLLKAFKSFDGVEERKNVVAHPHENGYSYIFSFLMLAFGYNYLHV